MIHKRDAQEVERMSFREAFREVIDLEGGYVDHPADKGGPTKWGICRAAYPRVDIKNLTKEEAAGIYLNDYWLPLQLDSIDAVNELIAFEIFEMAVNTGIRPAVIILQRALVMLGEHLKEDGVWGPKTKAATIRQAERDPIVFCKVLNGEQYAYYKRIVGSRPGQQVFFRGWMRRIFEGGQTKPVQEEKYGGLNGTTRPGNT